MENSKLKELLGVAASWQLIYAIPACLVAVFSMYSNAIAALFSLAMGILAISSATAIQRYKSSGNEQGLLTSFKHEKIYFILGTIYCLLISISLLATLLYIYRYGIEITQSPIKWSLRLAIDWLKD